MLASSLPWAIIGPAKAGPYVWWIILETVDDGDVRVVQRREELRLALKTREPVGIGGKRLG